MNSLSASTKKTIWIGLLTLATVLTTFEFACAVPMGALGAAAGLYMTRRDTLTLMALVWAANQFVGFVFLHYPADANTLLWGAIMLAMALAAGDAGHLTARFMAPNNSVSAHVAAFATACAASQIVCYIGGSLLPGYSFSLPILRGLLAVEAVTFLLLLVAYRSALSIGLISRPLPSRALA
jgi:hypothetical protein